VPVARDHRPRRGMDGVQGQDEAATGLLVEFPVQVVVLRDPAPDVAV